MSQFEGQTLSFLKLIFGKTVFQTACRLCGNTSPISDGLSAAIADYRPARF